jgi:hypothetical protein
MDEFLEEHKKYVKGVLKEYSLPFAFIDSSLYWCEETSMGFKIGLSVKINEGCEEYKNFVNDFSHRVNVGLSILEQSLDFVGIKIPEGYIYISEHGGDIFFEADTLKKFGRDDLGMYLAYLSKLGVEALSGANDMFSLKWGIRSRLHMEKLIERGILKDLSLLYMAGSSDEKEGKSGITNLLYKYFPVNGSLN